VKLFKKREETNRRIITYCSQSLKSKILVRKADMPSKIVAFGTHFCIFRNSESGNKYSVLSYTELNDLWYL
jgi:hypothetical protein